MVYVDIANVVHTKLHTLEFLLNIEIFVNKLYGFSCIMLLVLISLGVNEP